MGICFSLITFICSRNTHQLVLHISDGSDPRIGPGSARDWPFLKGLGSNFREGPKLGIGLRSMSRIEGPEGP